MAASSDRLPKALKSAGRRRLQCHKDRQASAPFIQEKSSCNSWTQIAPPPQLPQYLTMEMDRKPSEGDSQGAIEVSTQPTNTTSSPDEVRASKVITTYLLAQSKEFQQLSQLRQQVSPFSRQ